jgi:hypothetical protein
VDGVAAVSTLPIELPIEMPDAAATPVAEVLTGGADGSAAGGLMLAERIREGTLAPDPEAARAILHRARAMARRLAERPG